MTRDEAWRIATDTRECVIEHLDRVFTAPSFLVALRKEMDAAHAALYEAVAHMGAFDYSELYEDLYNPLFDALSLVTTGRGVLNSNEPRAVIVPRVRALCDEARSCLNQMLACSIPY